MILKLGCVAGIVPDLRAGLGKKGISVCVIE